MATTAARPLPRVRVVTLNWNAAELTARCLRSLLATEWPADRLEVVVVDNASVDGSLERLRSWFPDRVRFVANTRNVGFAEGCNTALRDLDGVDHVALVNNDAVVDRGWLAPAVEALESDPGLGAVSPKLLFATPFAPVGLEVRAPAEVVEVRVDGLEVTGRCLWGDGVASAPDGVVPLLLRHRIAASATVWVPVPDHPLTPPVVSVVLGTGDPFVLRAGGDPVAARPDGPHAVAEALVTADPQWRINNLGTGRTPWHEGIELHFGEPDRDLAPEEPPGWCGGGVVLRTDYLRDVGRFDPRFFAYYEDTDLSWRGRRAGWRYRTVPASVLRHVHGGSAGSSARGFFLLNYRNWLLTALRNGDRGERREALAWARHLAWGPTYTNVAHPLRHLRRPRPALTVAWAGVAAATAARAPAVLGSRSPEVSRTLGARPTTRVRSRLQSRPAPRAPAPRVGGPTVLYVDVTSTLAGGWRAGIQRVTTELVRRLPLVADIDVVAITWSDVDGRYRRLSGAEWTRLLDPGADTSPPPAVEPQRCTPAERAVLAASEAVMRLPRGIRPGRAVARLHRPKALRDLFLPRWERGAVLLDVDATWNVTGAPRRELLPELASAGVRVACFAHDVLPETHPDWFDPGLVEVFREHLRAHADHAEVVICNSTHTRDQFAAFLRARHPDRARGPAFAVCPLGGDPARDRAEAEEPPAGWPGPASGSTVVLAVGTVEPRKDHTTLLDAWDRVRDRSPGAVLVVIGRQGWHAEDVARRLRSHPDAGGRLRWLTDVDDADLARWYRRADVVVVPSLTEGYGLPVAEALAAGRATVASSGGALGEVGGDAVARFEPGDAEGLADLLGRLLADPAERHELARRAVAWQPPSWDDTARAVAEVLTGRPAGVGASAERPG